MRASARTWEIDAAGMGALALITILAWLSVVDPALLRQRQVRAVQDEIARQQGLMMQHDRDAARLGREIDDVRDRLARQGLKLRPRARLNSQMEAIVELASSSGVEILQTRTGAVESGPHYETVPISLAGKGAYGSCAAFLRRLREKLPDTGVVAFDLSGNPGRPSEPGAFRFDLVWHAAPAPAASAAVRPE